MEITVIDRRDPGPGFLTSLLRLNEVYMTNTTSMVNNVLAAAGQNRITRLNIIDHGQDGGMQLGDDLIFDDNMRYFRGTLSLLRGHFAADGFVHLQHCFVGNNRALLRTLAQIWQVPVFAGTGYHRPAIRFQDGQYVRCDPNGDCQIGVSRP